MKFQWLLACVAAVLSLAGAANSARAQWEYDADWEAPPEYYETLDGLTIGAALRSQLHLIIEKDYFSGSSIETRTQHRVNPYEDAGPALDVLDQAYARTGIFDTPYVNHIYDDEDVILTSPIARNREHVWSASRQNPGSRDNAGADYSDLYNLRWAYATTNSAKSNLNFGGVPVSSSLPNGDGRSGAYWYPGEAHKGDVARISFYMDVRYDGADARTGDLELVNGNPGYYSGAQQGDLASMLDWHYQDVVDPFELRRNHIIFSRSYENEFGSTTTPNSWTTQGNRNWAVDRPELVHAVYVDNANDTQVAIAGASVAGDGSSSVRVDLGTAIRGASVTTGGTQTLALIKTGLDGTYYSVTATSGATSSLNGRYNAFVRGSTDSESITVGYSGAVDANQAGFYGGTVTVDNLDVTTGAGMGRAARDGDDVISVGYTVLDHSNASFAAGADVNALVIDFGIVAQGSGLHTEQFNLFNLESTNGFTAGLDLDGVSVVGASGAALSTDLAAFAALAAGVGRGFEAALDTTATGSFSLTLELAFSDEDLPGAAGGEPGLLEIVGVVARAGDVNLDGAVDTADFTAWRTGFLSPGSLSGWENGDLNGDGAIDTADFELWRTAFLAPAGPTVADLGAGWEAAAWANGGGSVPEPSAGMLAALGLLAVVVRGRRN